MRIIVISDSHGSSRTVTRIVEENLDRADMFIHLGDGADDVNEVLAKYPDIKLLRIKGNCDWQDHPRRLVTEAGGVKIFACHGDLHGVRTGIDRLYYAAKEAQCSVALFGHTHCRFEHYEDGIYFLNPGSCTRPHDGKKPSYGFIDILPSGIMTGTVDV